MNKETRIFIWGLFLVILGGIVFSTYLGDMIEEGFSWFRLGVLIITFIIVGNGLYHVKRVL